MLKFIRYLWLISMTLRGGNTVFLQVVDIPVRVKNTQLYYANIKSH